MLKFFKPVFDYKLSFDPNKGDKYTVKVVYTVAMDAEGWLEQLFLLLRKELQLQF